MYLLTLSTIEKYFLGTHEDEVVVEILVTTKNLYHKTFKFNYHNHLIFEKIFKFLPTLMIETNDSN